MIERKHSRLERILKEHGQRWEIERGGLVWTAPEHPSPTALHIIVARELDELAEDRRVRTSRLSNASPANAKVAERQMIRPSFVPTPEIRQLRDVTRYRAYLVAARACAGPAFSPLPASAGSDRCSRLLMGEDGCPCR